MPGANELICQELLHNHIDIKTKCCVQENCLHILWNVMQLFLSFKQSASEGIVFSLVANNFQAINVAFTLLLLTIMH